MKKQVIFLLFFVALLSALGSCRNDNYKRNKSHAQVPLASIRKGERLAQTYCGSCHLLPDPSVADAHSWEEGILPNMGPRLGIFEYNFVPYPSGKNDPNLDSAVYPARPQLTGDEWQAIIDYYTATSPDTMPAQKREQNLQAELPFFEVQVPTPSATAPAITLVQIDTALTKNTLLSYDLVSQTLRRYNQKLVKTDSLETRGCVVNAVSQNGEWLLCNIGNINPNNAKLGNVQNLQTTPDGRFRSFEAPLAQRLARPVEVAPADINGDGRMDYVVCEFGFVTGSLSWLEQVAGGAFQRRVIMAVPGAIKTYVKDENSDGYPDLWVLFAQGDENISLFINQRNGQFRQTKMIQFPPSQGSTFFELADMNGDGLQDIIYTSGDNADYSQTLKPYHGVYIYINRSSNRFEKAAFFPINGCFKALARDFDKDGDLDIGTISFFADYTHQPEEGFVYLENKGNLKFTPYTFPESKSGRWLTMDAGDLDGDGWLDLVLGNFAAGPSFLPPPVDWKSGPSILLLRNITSKKSL
jgi:hypothetical protein